jgi:hypothetical protein
MLRSLGGASSLGRRMARCSCVSSGCRRHYGGISSGFVVVVVVRGASVLKVNLRYFRGLDRRHEPRGLRYRCRAQTGLGTRCVPYARPAHYRHLLKGRLILPPYYSQTAT